MAQNILCLIFFTLFGQMPLCAVVCLLFPSYDLQLVVFLLSLHAALALFLGDLIILAASGADVPRDQSWDREFFLNAVHRIRPGKVSYYVSREYDNNIYLLAVPGRSSVVIGDALRRKLTRQELEVLIIAALHCIKIGGVWKKTFWTNLLLLGMWPLMILSYLTPSYNPAIRAYDRVGKIGRFCFFYTVLLQNNFLPKERNLSSLNLHVDKFLGDNKTFPAILFKIGTLPQVNGNFWNDFLMKGVQLTSNTQSTFLGNISG